MGGVGLLNLRCSESGDHSPPFWCSAAPLANTTQKFNIAFEHVLSQKESSLPTSNHHFSGAMGYVKLGVLAKVGNLFWWFKISWTNSMFPRCWPLCSQLFRECSRGSNSCVLVGAISWLSLRPSLELGEHWWDRDFHWHSSKPESSELQIRRALVG